MNNPTADTASKTIFDEYESLLTRVDAQSARLYQKHAPHITCHRGCYYCCTTIWVSPLELAWVLRYIAEERRRGTAAVVDSGRVGPDAAVPPIPAVDKFAGSFPEDSELREARSTPRCALLRSGVCSVYPARPVICRVHGLPLAYPVFEYDADGRQVAGTESDVALVWCDLNFRAAHIDPASRNDIIFMRDLYGSIEELNGRFLTTPAGRAFGGKRQVKLDPVLTTKWGSFD